MLHLRRLAGPERSGRGFRQRSLRDRNATFRKFGRSPRRTRPPVVRLPLVPVGERPGRTLTWSNATLRLSRLQGGIETSLNESQLALVREAFTMWAAVANVKFREVADSDESDIRVGLGNIDGPGGTAGEAQSWTEGGFNIRSNIRFDTGNYPRSSTVSRERFLRTALHEIGHALGSATAR